MYIYYILHYVYILNTYFKKFILNNVLQLQTFDRYYIYNNRKEVMFWLIFYNHFALNLIYK